MEQILCVYCGDFFDPSPRHKNQTACKRAKCQRAKKAAWQRHKLKTDPIYAARATTVGGIVFALTGSDDWYADAEPYRELVALGATGRSVLAEAGELEWISSPSPEILVAYPADETGRTAVFARGLFRSSIQDRPRFVDAQSLRGSPLPAPPSCQVVSIFLTAPGLRRSIRR